MRPATAVATRPTPGQYVQVQQVRIAAEVGALIEVLAVPQCHELSAGSTGSYEICPCACADEGVSAAAVKQVSATANTARHRNGLAAKRPAKTA